MYADTRLPIELWAGRDAQQLAAWLRTHPGVEVVCRDGSLVYRQGITDGAPDAVRVSDRFHLWQGLSKRVSGIAAAHRDCLPAAVLKPEPALPPPTERSGTADTPARRHAKRLFEAVPAVSGARPLAQRHGPRAGTEPTHRGQIRAGTKAWFILSVWRSAAGRYRAIPTAQDSRCLSAPQSPHAASWWTDASRGDHGGPARRACRAVCASQCTRRWPLSPLHLTT
ncbi:transposase [Streptomyces sp. NPDC059161]|uniref:transposase n=1 Tax=Streptomyces sp. NPDC059161 TaxID=3346749 RepID=UPI0036A6513D